MYMMGALYIPKVARPTGFVPNQGIAPLVAVDGVALRHVASGGEAVERLTFKSTLPVFGKPSDPILGALNDALSTPPFKVVELPDRTVSHAFKLGL